MRISKPTTELAVVAHTLVAMRKLIDTPLVFTEYDEEEGEEEGTYWLHCRNMPCGDLFYCRGCPMEHHESLMVTENDLPFTAMSSKKLAIAYPEMFI